MEIVLCALVVRTQGTLIRPALIYLLPVGRASLLLGQRDGLIASLLVWSAYSINIAPGAWPDHLGDFPNYLSFFLAPYAVAVILSLAIVRQERARQSIQALYDQLSVAHEELRALHQEVRSAAVAEERNRLAREIHDSLAHYLTVANVQLEVAEKLGAERRRDSLADCEDCRHTARRPSFDAAFEHVRRARRLTLECLQDVRRSVAATRAATLEELTIEPLIRRLVGEFGESTGTTGLIAYGTRQDVSSPTAWLLLVPRFAVGWAFRNGPGLERQKYAIHTETAATIAPAPAYVRCARAIRKVPTASSPSMLIQIENVRIAAPLMPAPPAISMTTSNSATVAASDRPIDCRLARCWSIVSDLSLKACDQP